MKKKLMVISFAIVLTMALAVSVSTSALAVKPIHQASGGGNLEWSTSSYNVTFGFVAHQIDQEGNAKGQLQANTVVGDEIIDYSHGEVIYLAVNTATGEAWMGCNVTESSQVLPGTEFVWRVQDNGQGNGATGPDMTSYLNIRPAIDALSMPSDVQLVYEWTNGNVQVK